MRTYKETLGIIKRANGLPLMGANAQGYSQAFIDAYNGGGFNQAPSFVQTPQQSDLSSLSAIGTYLPFLLSAGGLFNSNNAQAQTQPQKQVTAQTTPTTSTWDAVKDTAGKVWQGVKDFTGLLPLAIDSAADKNMQQRMNNINATNPYLKSTMKSYSTIQKNLSEGQSNPLAKRRETLYNN